MAFICHFLACIDEHDAVKFAFFVVYADGFSFEEKLNRRPSNCILKKIVILRE